LELQPLQPHPFRIESPQTLQQHVRMAWSIIVNVIIIIINRADKPIRLLFFFFWFITPYFVVGKFYLFQREKGFRADGTFVCLKDEIIECFLFSLYPPFLFTRLYFTPVLTMMKTCDPDGNGGHNQRECVVTRRCQCGDRSLLDIQFYRLCRLFGVFKIGKKKKI
jgi:hypothetical protein